MICVEAQAILRFGSTIFMPKHFFIFGRFIRKYNKLFAFLKHPKDFIYFVTKFMDKQFYVKIYLKHTLTQMTHNFLICLMKPTLPTFVVWNVYFYFPD